MSALSGRFTIQELSPEAYRAKVDRVLSWSDVRLPSAIGREYRSLQAEVRERMEPRAMWARLVGKRGKAK